jgi:flagellar capping protein FliD
MNETIDQKATSILAGVRDNLLKPMAKEIEQKQQNNCDELIKAIGELKSALESKIAMLENKIANLEKFQQEKERQSSNAMQQVKWDE